MLDVVLAGGLSSPLHSGVVVLDQGSVIVGGRGLIRVSDFDHDIINEPGQYADHPYFLILARDNSFDSPQHLYDIVLRDITDRFVQGSIIDLESVRQNLPMDRHYYISELGPNRIDYLESTYS